MSSYCSATCRSWKPCGFTNCPYDKEVLVAADNSADGVYDMKIEDNIIRGGSGRILLGTGNDAKGDNRSRVNKNEIIGANAMVEIGVVNTAGGHGDMDIAHNKVQDAKPGGRVIIGAANQARTDNCMKIMRNTVKNSTDLVHMGAYNKAGSDNMMKIHDNEVHGGGGGGRVGIGCGNGSTRGTNTARVSGNKIYR